MRYDRSARVSKLSCDFMRSQEVKFQVLLFPEGCIYKRAVYKKPYCLRPAHFCTLKNPFSVVESGDIRLMDCLALSPDLTLYSISQMLKGGLVQLVFFSENSPRTEKSAAGEVRLTTTGTHKLHDFLYAFTL